MMNEENLKLYFENNKGEILENIKKLIKIPSVLEENLECIEAPFGNNNVEALKFMLKLGEDFGFKTYNCDNVAGHIEYGDGNEVFAVLCHTDVVPAIGNWKHDPFESYIEDGKIFGRGSIDDKGPAIISLYALKYLKDNNIKVNKKIRLIIGTDEESGSRGVKRYIEKVGMPDSGISPDAEFPIIYGEKGMISFDILYKGKSDIDIEGGLRYNIVCPLVDITVNNNLDEYLKILKDNNDVEVKENKIKVYGVSAHAMEPLNGKNAICTFSNLVKNITNNKLIKFIGNFLMDTRLKDLGLDYKTLEMGDMTMNIGFIKKVDDVIRLGINVRYPQGFDYDEFIKKFKSSLKEYKLEMEIISHSKPHYVDPNSEFIKKLHESYIKYTNDYSPLKTIGGGTYARELTLGVAYGVLFPGEEEMAHQANEFADINNLFKAGVIITDAIYNVCK